MASDIHLINCASAIVHGDVERYTAIGVTGLVVDNTYNDLHQIGSKLAAVKPNVSTVIGDFTIDGKYYLYEIDLDAIGTNVTCTWDASLYPLHITFKVTNNAGLYSFIISNISGGGVDGAPSPYNTGFVTMESKSYYASGIYVYSEAGNTGGTGASSFITLSDTPASYAGQAGKVATVNMAENALEFTVSSGSGAWGSIGTGTGLSTQGDLMTLISLRL